RRGGRRPRRIPGVLPEPAEGVRVAPRTAIRKETRMRDVIVIGSGGGGAVVAKELAARGLDGLLLEAGPNYTDIAKEGPHFEAAPNSPVSGSLRFGPADRPLPPWRRDLPQTTLLSQVSGVGGTTLHYFANSPRAMPGAFDGYASLDAGAY